jgi:hypothetical protein
MQITVPTGLVLFPVLLYGVQLQTGAIAAPIEHLVPKLARILAAF